MSAALTAQVGVKLGPIIIGTLIQHFLRRDIATKDSKAREELLYDEAFTIVKKFMDDATKHTVEEIQAFSNSRIPSPPWVRTVRVMVPLACCDRAADELIKAFGGVEAAREAAGGVRWWQVRGLDGVPAEWICVRKDIDARRKQHKAELRRTKSARMSGPDKADDSKQSLDDDKKPEPHIYSTEMDGTPCMLYIHGGGGYFGSIDQERYMMHRYARKISGRVFAVNYRLAPQYPFPCALQDVLAAYLYLIDPPPGAHHIPVDPSLIIPAGDSAGGNLTLALLQVIRDAGLPQPAGAVLISPWCDMAHSFASCYENMPSDIIPPYGLALHKPSTLWPPPTATDTAILRDRISGRLQKAIRRGFNATSEDDDADTITFFEHDGHKHPATLAQRTTALGDKVTLNTVPIPSVKEPIGDVASSSTMSPASFSKLGMKGASAASINIGTTAIAADGAMLLVDGKVVTINSQIQFYCTNSQINHPYVSPVVAYLGGLPPCLFIVSDKECLRDEIVYVAHRAANPEFYGVKEETRHFHPPHEGIEQRYSPTDVHLQIYDETCHVLPIYSFTTPAKYCYRAIATFCKYVIHGDPKSRQSTQSSQSSYSNLSNVHSEPDALSTSAMNVTSPSPLGVEDPSAPQNASNPRPNPQRLPSRRPSQLAQNNSTKRKPSLLRRLSLSAVERKLHHGTGTAENQPGDGVLVSSPLEEEPDDILSQVGIDGSRVLPNEPGTAGNPFAYVRPPGISPFENHMIRERISTRGVIRPMEPAEENAACMTSLDQVAVLNERSVRRYIEGQALWDRKFSGVTKSIEKSRQKHLKVARKEGLKTLDNIRNQLKMKTQDGSLQPPGSRTESDSHLNSAIGSVASPVEPDDSVHTSEVYSKTILGSRQWTWGWVLEGENPPPASIVSRRDTQQALHLSRFADRQLGPTDAEHQLSGNHLWSVIVEALAAHGRKEAKKQKETHRETSNTAGTSEDGQHIIIGPQAPHEVDAGAKAKHRRSLSRFFTLHRKSEPTPASVS